GFCWSLFSIVGVTVPSAPMTMTSAIFWRFGKWVDVVIDDKLPTINGRPIFVQSKKQNEFWPSLLEKAYAKVCGSYADMNAGTLAEAMVDFTGGVHMCIQLSDPPSDLWESMSRAGRFGALMGCSTPKGESSSLSLCPNGLVQGHAYTVTGVIQVKTGKPVKIVRLWNPWGKGEWNGDWSDQSSIWKTVSPQDRENCLSVAEDGEFWMTLEDLCEFYTELDLCGLNPDFLDEDSSGLWRSSIAEGRWVAGTTAGGCMNNRGNLITYCRKTAAKNILVSLMQKPDKRNRHLVQNFHIGFTVFEVKDQPHKGKFPASFFSAQKPAAQTKTFINAREVMEFLTLMPGEYVIVPSTFNPNETSSFILTIHCRTETLCYIISFLQYEEVDAEQVQRILNEKLLKGFSIDACRSMVALMDVSCSKAEYTTCSNKTAGFSLSDDMLNLMALRYGASSGHMTLESFISLILRLECMFSK
uniref:Calpain catalytic domain-containing protein n=1 Tax=Cyprinodon variegatus TaxID=28743 RepID=A0A3Q2E209_CYPVA